jgi:hypothetical protein
MEGMIKTKGRFIKKSLAVFFLSSFIFALLPTPPASAALDPGGAGGVSSYTPVATVRVYIKDPNSDDEVPVPCIPITATGPDGTKLDLGPFQNEAGVRSNFNTSDVALKTYTPTDSATLRATGLSDGLWTNNKIQFPNIFFHGNSDQKYCFEKNWEDPAVLPFRNDGIPSGDNNDWAEDIKSTGSKILNLVGYTNVNGFALLLPRGLYTIDQSEDNPLNVNEGPTKCLPDGNYTFTVSNVQRKGIERFVKKDIDSGRSWLRDWLSGNEVLSGSVSFKVKSCKGPSETLKIVLNQSTQGGTLNNMLATAVNTMIQALNNLAVMGINGINSLLSWESNKILDRETLGNAWETVRNIALSLLTLFLVLIAFANALQYNIEKFGLNRIVPKIIIAIILSWLSWAIATFMFDLANAFQNSAWEIGSTTLDSLGSGEIISSGDTAATLAALIAAVVILILLVLSIFALFITLLVRVVMLSFLIVVSPIAFILYILPFTEQYYKRWWKEFFKWILMGPLVVMILAIGLIVLNNEGGSATNVSPSELNTSGIDVLIRLMIFAGFVVFASIIPLTLGGKLMDKLGMSKLTGDQLTKRALSKGASPITSRGKAFMAQRRASVDERRNLGVERFRNWVANNKATKAPGVGYAARTVAGVNKNQAATLGQRARANWVKSQNPDQYTDDVLHDKMYKAKSEFEQLAWAEHIAASGKWTKGESAPGATDAEKEKNKKLNQAIFDKFAPNNGIITNGVAKSDNDVLLKSAHKPFVERGQAAAAKKDITAFGTGEIEALGKIATHGHPEDKDGKLQAGAQAIISKWGPDQIERAATRQGGKNLEAFTDKDVAQHMNTKAIDRIERKLQEREYAPNSKPVTDLQEAKVIKAASTKREMNATHAEALKDNRAYDREVVKSAGSPRQVSNMSDYQLAQAERTVRKEAAGSPAYENVMTEVETRAHRDNAEYDKKIMTSAANAETVSKMSDSDLRQAERIVHKNAPDSPEYNTVMTEVHTRANRDNAEFDRHRGEGGGEEGGPAPSGPAPSGPTGGGGSAGGGAAPGPIPSGGAPSGEGGGSFEPEDTGGEPTVASGGYQTSGWSSSPEPTKTHREENYTQSSAPSAPSDTSGSGFIWDEPAYKARLNKLPEKLRPKPGKHYTEEELRMVEEVFAKPIERQSDEAWNEENKDILKPGVKLSGEERNVAEFLQEEHPSVEMKKKLGNVDGIKKTNSEDKK